MRNNLLLLFCVFILSVSCTKEIEIDIPPAKPKLIVYSTFVPFTTPYPKSFSVKVSSSAHIFDTTKYPITDAIVQLYKNNELLDTLQYFSDCDCYTVSGMFYPQAQAGDKYSLKVEREGFETVTASTSIPSKVLITDTLITPIAYINEFNCPISEVQISFTDPIDEINYYELAITEGGINYDDYENYYEISTNATIITSQSYYPDLIRFDVHYPKFLLFSDENINGQPTTLALYYDAPHIFDSIHFIPTHYITIHLRNVTKEYYDFKTSSIQQDYAKREDFLYGMGEPVNVISNIENGFGVFAGFNNDYFTYRVNSLVVNK